MSCPGGVSEPHRDGQLYVHEASSFVNQVQSKTTSIPITWDRFNHLPLLQAILRRCQSRDFLLGARTGA